MIEADKNKILDDGMPVGFGMALAMQPGGMETFASLSDDKKVQYLSRARSAKSKREMQQIVQELMQGNTYTG